MMLTKLGRMTREKKVRVGLLVTRSITAIRSFRFDFVGEERVTPKTFSQ